MMLSRMLAEVVSLARPGSSDGGSVPQLTVKTCSAASRAAFRGRRAGAGASSSSPPQPPATSAKLETSSAEPQPKALDSHMSRPSVDVHQVSGAFRTPLIVLARYTSPKPVNRTSLRRIYASTTVLVLLGLLLTQPALAHVDVQPRLVELGKVTDLRIELPQLRAGAPPERLEVEGEGVTVLAQQAGGGRRRRDALERSPASEPRRPAGRAAAGPARALRRRRVGRGGRHHRRRAGGSEEEAVGDVPVARSRHRRRRSLSPSASPRSSLARRRSGW